MADLSRIDPWFEITPLGSGAFAIREPFHVEAVLSYLVLGSERGVLIDTGMGIGDIRGVVDALTDLPVTVLNSHAHWDHIGGNWQFSEIAIHVAEAERLPRGRAHDDLADALAPDQFSGPLPPSVDLASFAIRPSIASMALSGGESFDLGDRQLETMHMPGHSPGGLVILDRAKRVLYSTDVAYPGMLYAHGPDANLSDYARSLATLATLVDEIDDVQPSHNGTSMAPEMLTRMSAAMDAVLEGRAPDEVNDEFAQHRFDGFSILVPPDAGPGNS